MTEIVQLTTEHLREIREAIERLRAVHTRFDRSVEEFAKARHELRETRTALEGLCSVFSLRSGELKAGLSAIHASLDRLDGEPA